MRNVQERLINLEEKNKNQDRCDSSCEGLGEVILSLKNVVNLRSKLQRCNYLL